MVARECLVAADPARSAASEKPYSGFSRLVQKVFPAASGDSESNIKSSQQLLLPCLLGDPFICLSVDRRVGVSAGTLLGRLSLFYWPPPPPFLQNQEEQPEQQTQHQRGIRGQELLPQAYSDDGVAVCWMDTTYVTAIMGASDVSIAT